MVLVVSTIASNTSCYLYMAVTAWTRIHKELPSSIKFSSWWIDVKLPRKWSANSYPPLSIQELHVRNTMYIIINYLE
jgi:hypothetical protein